MRQGRLTLWKIEVVVLLAAIFCAVIKSTGLVPGVALIYISIPLWSVAVWLMLTERQSAVLRDAAATVMGALLLAWIAAWLVRYAFGVRLPSVLNRLTPAMLQYVVIGMGGGYWLASKIKAKWLGPEGSDAESPTGDPPPPESSSPPTGTTP